MALLAPPPVARKGFSGTDIPPDEVIARCVQCGFCLPTCPTYLLTYNEASSPRGRIHLMRSVADGRLSLDSPVFRDQMYQCLNCRACEAVCPSGVAYGQIIEPARAQIERHLPRPLWERLLRIVIFRHLFGDMRLFRLFSLTTALYQKSGLRAIARRTGLLKSLHLEDQEGLLPEIPMQAVVPVGQRWLPSDGQVRHRVGLFTGCVMSTAFAGTDRATARVLTRNGCEVIAVADQGCCGALAIHAGEPDIGRECARRNIAAFERQGLDAIIINSAGCGAALKEYPHLFHSDLGLGSTGGALFQRHQGCQRVPGRDRPDSTRPAAQDRDLPGAVPSGARPAHHRRAAPPDGSDTGAAPGGDGRVESLLRQRRHLQRHQPGVFATAVGAQARQRAGNRRRHYHLGQSWLHHAR